MLQIIWLAISNSVILYVYVYIITCIGNIIEAIEMISNSEHPPRSTQSAATSKAPPVKHPRKIIPFHPKCESLITHTHT